MVNDIDKKIEALISDIEGLRKQYDNAIKAKEEEYAKLVKRTADLNSSIESLIASISDKSKTADKQLLDIIDMSKTLDNIVKNNARSIETTKKQKADIENAFTKIRSDTDDLGKKVATMKSFYDDIKRQMDTIKKEQEELEKKHTSIKNKSEDTIANLKIAETAYYNKANAINMEFVKGTNKIKSLSDSVDKIQNSQIVNYDVATGEAKKHWEDAIIEIINNNMEIVEMKEGVFKKRFVLTKKQ